MIGSFLSRQPSFGEMTGNIEKIFPVNKGFFLFRKILGQIVAGKGHICQQGHVQICDPVTDGDGFIEMIPAHDARFINQLIIILKT